MTPEGWRKKHETGGMEPVDVVIHGLGGKTTTVRYERTPGDICRALKVSDAPDR